MHKSRESPFSTKKHEAMKLNIREKITGLLVFYFLVALVAIGSTLFVSWRLEGGAAAINDAGSERMRSYHIAFLLAQQVQHPSAGLRHDIAAKVAKFEKVLTDLEHGDPLRPLALPKDPQVRAQMGRLRQDWQTSKLTAMLANASQGGQGSEGSMSLYV